MAQAFARGLRGMFRSFGTSAASPSKLDQVVNVEMLSQESSAAIRDIWESFHSSRKAQQVGAVLTSAEYNCMAARCSKSPMIALPVWKSLAQGASASSAYVTVLVQAQLPTVLVTTVDDYKSRGADAPARFMATIYTELAGSRDLVLIRGDIIDEKLLDWDDAKHLLTTICDVYIKDDRFQHVHAFNHDPSKFDFNAVLRACTTEE